MTRTPAEHFKIAELLLDRFDNISAEHQYRVSEQVTRALELMLQRAQVHATLATVDPAELP